MTNFADYLQETIKRTSSYLVAGLDPRLEDFPTFIIDEVRTKSSTNEDLIYNLLTSFYGLALEELKDSIAAAKPNIAFFEQYGLPGLKAYGTLIAQARELRIPLIADAKRGDIGSTASAYSAAFLGRVELFGQKLPVLNADAVTVNPFLGFDTVEVLIKDCVEYGKGIFVLVKTSNPGSTALQGNIRGNGDSLSEQIAAWLAEKSTLLTGNCGYSGLGAVVGATYPEEAARLRQVMPTNIFLIPGLGAQGGTAQDAVAGFAKNPQTGQRGGAIINVSRGLFGKLPASATSRAGFIAELKSRAKGFNEQISQALK